MNILVYRTVRTEEMGYVIRDICTKYGDDNNIKVITRPENKVTMESIEGIDEVILYSNNIFQFNNKLKSQIIELKKHKFDIVIIPTNGNVEGYRNVYKFHNKVYGKGQVLYYKYPKEFVINNISSVNRLVFNLFSFILSVPILLAYLVICYIKLLTKKLKVKS
jgi:hypothetical protein